MTLNDEREIRRIVKFIKDNGGQTYKDFDKDELAGVVDLHLQYGTCMIIRDGKNNICAVARWNISGTTAEVLDVIVRKDYRNKNFLKMMLGVGITKYPYVRFLKFQRGIKYPGRKHRIYSVNEFLRKRRRK
jgi:hypothetical protein